MRDDARFPGCLGSRGGTDCSGGATGGAPVGPGSETVRALVGVNLQAARRCLRAASGVPGQKPEDLRPILTAREAVRRALARLARGGVGAGGGPGDGGSELVELRILVTAPPGVEPEEVLEWGRWRLRGGECDPAVAELLDERGRVVSVSSARAGRAAGGRA